MPMVQASQRLMLAGMATEAERRQRQRRGYWLRLARQRAGLTLKQVAVETYGTVGGPITLDVQSSGCNWRFIVLA